MISIRTILLVGCFLALPLLTFAQSKSKKSSHHPNTCCAQCPEHGGKNAKQAVTRKPIQIAKPLKVTSVEGINEYVLHNGLRVLLMPDNSKPKTLVNITYLVGSRHEGYGESGMAHLLEHMLFKGSKNHPNIPQESTDHGADPKWYKLV